MNISHVWFDLDGTLTVASPRYKKAHKKLLLTTYAKARNRPLTDALKDEFENAYKKHGSNSLVFSSLGFPSNYWINHLDVLDPQMIYKKDQRVITTLLKLKKSIPISLFTNNSLKRVHHTFKAIGLKHEWFRHIVSGDDVPFRKPKPDGFYHIAKVSQAPIHTLLYIGDRVETDIIPSKSVGFQTGLVYSSSHIADFSFNKFEDILSLLPL